MSRRLLHICNFKDNLVRYSDGLALQEALASARKLGVVEDVLLLLQHHPVFTIGKRGSLSDFKVPPQELAARGIDVEHIPRGGETTFHGPGQLVAYPIIDIRAAGLGARTYVEGLEDVMLRVAGQHGLQARGRVPGLTGVWVGERKIGAVGVRISHGISSHGTALNVNTALSYFDLVVPCGIKDKKVTSLAQELGRAALPFDRVSRQFQRTFTATFGYHEVRELAPQELRARLAQAQ